MFAMPRDYEPDPRAAIDALVAEILEDDALSLASGIDFGPPSPVTSAPPLLPLEAWLRRSEEVHRFLRSRGSGR
jgi:hypothetical protein